MTAQRNRFMTDILSTLFDRSDRLRAKSDGRNIRELCHAWGLRADGAAVSDLYDIRLNH
jgi:hypothetical protein